MVGAGNDGVFSCIGFNIILLFIFSVYYLTSMLIGK